ncbi:MAG: ABC transporter permease [Steroidobacteraceae bacterium]
MMRPPMQAAGWRHLGRSRFGIIAAFIVTVATFAVLSPVFLTAGNLVNIANQTAIISILGFAMTLVMLSGGIDLSVGSLVSLSSVLVALQLDAKLPLAAAIATSLAAGALLGATAGFIIAHWRIQSFLVTLGLLSVARGLSLVLSEGRTLYIEDSAFLDLTALGTAGPIPALMIWTLVTLALAWILLNRSTFGRRVRALGGNAEAARQAGISALGVSVRVFMLSGSLAAFAGLLMAGRLSAGIPTVGVGLELDAIAAAVLGGTGFKGEGGSLAGTLFGALIMGTLVNGFVLLGINPYVQEIAKGVIIVLAVILLAPQRSS